MAVTSAAMVSRAALAHTGATHALAVLVDQFDLDVRGLGQFTDLHRLHLLIATAQQLNRLTL